MPEFLPPEASRVLVLSPHPDDEALGCSGTLLLYAEQGSEICLAVLSNGEKLEVGTPHIGGIRKAEAASAADLIGIRKTLFLEFPDEQLDMHREEMRGALAGIIREFRPDVVFAPSPIDPHPDHRAVSEVALQLLSEFPWFTLAFYEIYHPFRFTTPVDISPVIDRKKEVVFAYRNSLLGMPDLFWRAIEGLNRYRSLVFKRSGMYEAFWVTDRPLSKEEIIAWATFDYKTESPAELFLSRLKAADTLIFELQKAQQTLEQKEVEISQVRSALSEAEVNLRLREEENRGLRKGLELISDSLLWRSARSLYRLRDRLLPEKTRRRERYDRLLKRLKRGGREPR